MKDFLVFGHTSVTVSCIVRADDDISEEELFLRAGRQFGGIHEYAGNGGDAKLIGVEDQYETIAADEPIVWDDYLPCSVNH